MMSSPVKCIDEILALPHSADDFRNQEVPPSDDDSWLYTGEDELNSALLERQKEMELYDAMHGKKQKLKEPSDTGPSNHSNGDCDLSNIAKTMDAFVHKVSSYKGVEIPDQRSVCLIWKILSFSCLQQGHARTGACWSIVTMTNRHSLCGLPKVTTYYV